MGPDDFGIDDLAATFQRNAQLRATHQLRQQKAAAEANRQAMPQCPFCGGRLEGQFELCVHCRSQLSWVRGVPCKPGQESRYEALYQEHQEERRFNERRRRYFDDHLGMARIYPRIGDKIALVLLPIGVLAGLASLVGLVVAKDAPIHQYAPYLGAFSVGVLLLALASWLVPLYYLDYRTRIILQRFVEVFQREQHITSPDNNQKGPEKGPYGF